MSQQRALPSSPGAADQPPASADASRTPPAPPTLLELPLTFMRPLLAEHVDDGSRVALLGTSRALARATLAEHCPEDKTLVLHRDVFMEEELLTTWSPALVALLLDEWRVPRLHLDVSGYRPTDDRGWHMADPASTFQLPPQRICAVLTALRLHEVHVLPAHLEALQQCQRLQALTLSSCTFAADGPGAEAAALAVAALPHLTELTALNKLRAGGTHTLQPRWAHAALQRLASNVEWLEQCGYFTWPWPDFPRLQALTLRDELLDHDFAPLLQHPTLQHVYAEHLSIHEDHQGVACHWRTLTVEHLALERLPNFPLSGPRPERITVTRGLGYDPWHGNVDGEVVQALEQLGDRLVVEPQQPEREIRLTLSRDHLPPALRQHIQRLVLPPGGGPTSLHIMPGYPPAPVVALMAPLLVGTRVRAVRVNCNVANGPSAGQALAGIPALLPPSVTHLLLDCYDQAAHLRLVLQHPPTHPLSVTVCSKDFHGRPLPTAEFEALRQMCAAHQPPVTLRRGAWWTLDVTPLQYLL